MLQLRHSLVSAKKKSWQDERLFNQDYQKNLSFIFYISAQSMTIYNEYNVTSIGCFHCTSIGGDNPACEDPFNSTEAFEKGLYKDNCLAGLKGRGGLYPATACIKFDGYYSKYFSSIFMNASWIMKNSKVARPEGRKFFFSLENFFGAHCVLNNLFIGCSSHAQRGKGHKSAHFFASENCDTAGFVFVQWSISHNF